MARFFAAFLFVLVPCLAAPPPGFTKEILVKNLDSPTDVEFFPDGTGRAFFVENYAGKITLVSSFNDNPPTLSTYLKLVSNFNNGGERGLLDACFAPDFANAVTKYVYTYYSAKTYFRIARFTHVENGLASILDPASEFVVWEDVDTYKNNYHYGGRINFGPDGAIYLSQGEKELGNPKSQSWTSYASKVTRVYPDGTFPSDNPGLLAGGLPGIWLRGLRNGFTASWDLPTNRYFIFNVGGNDQSTAYEAVYIGGYNKTFAWPLCEGPCGNPHFTAPECACGVYDDPVYSWNHNNTASAVIGGFVYRGSMFPSFFKGKLFVADYSRTWIKYLEFDSTGQKVISDTDFDTKTYSAWTELKEGPEGAMYFTNYNGEVGRYVFTPTGNFDPVITAIAATPSAAETPALVQFSGTGIDYNNYALSYTWHFGDVAGSTSTGAQAQFTYTLPGVYVATLTLSNGVSTVNKTVVVEVKSNFKPYFVSPVSGTKFDAGTVVTVNCAINGTADPGTTVSVAIAFKELSSSTSQVISTINKATGTFSIPSSLNYYSSSSFSFTCSLKNKLSQVISSTVSTITPNMVYLTLQSTPVNTEVLVNGFKFTTPYSYGALKGSSVTLEANAEACIFGYLYSFSSWSDSGTLSHSASFAQDTTLTMTLATSSVTCDSLTSQDLAIHVVAGVNTLKDSAGNVVFWGDETSNKNDLVPTSDAGVVLSPPQLISGGLNGYDYVAFDGVSQALRVADFKNFTVGTGGATIVAVVSYEGDGWGGISYGQAACNAAFGMGVSAGNGNIFIEDYCDANEVESGVPSINEGFFVETVVYQNGMAAVFKNGALVQIKDIASDIPSDFVSLVVGVDQGLGTFIHMNVAEFYVFSKTLSDYSRVALESELLIKYFAVN